MKKALAKKQEGTAIMIVRAQTLGKAPEEKTFVLKDGRKLRTVYELIDELETMNDSLFNEYANKTKNDFANWIRDVFSDRPLADELSKIQSRIDAQRAILKHVVRELKKLAKQ